MTNSTAVAFTQALLQKYINYFAGKGCQLFNMGADEYANDKYKLGSMGFGNLQSDGKYGSYVTYVNKLAAMIKNAGMKPMAFNDGIYFNNNTSSGTFDTDIIICYWSSGWGTYNPMPASTLDKMGFRLVNTDGSYYWVLGKTDTQCSANKASGFKKNSFPGNSTIDNPVGSMFCIWADYPGAETGESVISKTADTIAAFGKALPEVKKVETVEAKTVTKDNVTVTAPGLTDLTVAAADAPAIDAAAEGKVVAYNVTPATASGNYKKNGTVTLPIPEGWDASRVRGFVQNEDGSITTVTGTPADGKFTFTVPHFSVLGVYELAANAVDKTENVKVVVGEDKTVTVTGRNDAGSYTTEDPSVATVKVTGTDEIAESVTYPKVDNNITYNDLINSNSTTWKETGYYYQATDGNYYQLLVKRSSTRDWFWDPYTYTYTWGYKDSSDNIQSAGSKETTDTGASLDFSIYTKETTPASPAKTTIVFKGVKAGTTTVTIGDVKYNITVTAEDLSKVTPLTIEYWITNGPVLKDKNSSTTAVSVSATKEIATETGVSVAALVPGSGIKESEKNADNPHTLEYWQAKLLNKSKPNNSSNGTEEQTTRDGDDETLSGSAFTKVRYWGGTWQVYTTEWVTVKSTDQLVAYYMEVINIKNKNNVENLHVNAADWGLKGDGTTALDYNPGDTCSVSVQLVYEDGSTSPSATTAAELKSKTIVYSYWNGGRGLGTMVFNGKDNYQIFKVTAETGDMSSTTSSKNTVTVNSFTWDNNEETVWEGAATDSVSIGNPVKNPSYDTPYDNLAWNTSGHNNNNAILIRVYVKSIPKAGALTVNYFVQGNADPFYHYGINVFEETTFDADFGRVEDANAPGKARLINNSVTNYDGEQQEVQSDLSKMTEIGAQYRYSNYTFTNAERSTDGKTVNLYYTFNWNKAFVVDFGLPVVIRPNDVNENLKNATLTAAEITQSTTYANISVDNDKNITYTLKQTIDGDDNFSVRYMGNITTDNGTQTGHVDYSIKVIPATSVYYEDSFATFNPGAGAATDAKWSIDKDDTAAKVETNQALSALGAQDIYGYDKAYKDSTKLSMGSAHKVTVSADMAKTWTPTSQWPTATFTFKGTGFDVISLTDNTSGAIFVDVYAGKGTSGKRVKSYIVDNYYGYKQKKDAAGNITWVVDQNAKNALYQIPVMKINDLTYGEYTAVITVFYDGAFNQTTSNQYNFWLDAIRVYNPMGTGADANANYVKDSEGYPQYIKLHDELVKTGSSIDAKLRTTVFIDGAAEATIAQYKNYGPNNEVYLANGQAITFKIPANANIASIQIGAKAPNGTAKMTVTGTDDPKEISSATEMYYKVNVDATAADKEVTIANEGTGILSLTNLKITFKTNPNATVTLAALTDDDQANAVAQVRALFAEPVEPFNPDLFKASWGHSVRKGDTATLTVKASEDVEAIEVDGQMIDKYVTRTERTGWGWWAKTVTFREFTYTDTATVTKDYTVCAVNGKGVSSDAITATLTVRPSVRDWLHGIFGKWF